MHLIPNLVLIYTNAKKSHFWRILWNKCTMFWQVFHYWVCSKLAHTDFCNLGQQDPSYVCSLLKMEGGKSYWFSFPVKKSNLTNSVGTHDSRFMIHDLCLRLKTNSVITSTFLIWSTGGKTFSHLLALLINWYTIYFAIVTEPMATQVL